MTCGVEGSGSVETISWAEPLRGGWGYGDWRVRGLKRWEREAEIAGPEGSERKVKAVSGRCEKDGGCPWATQTRAGAGPRSGEAIGSGCDTTEPVMTGRWTSEHLDAPHGTASTVGTAA